MATRAKPASPVRGMGDNIKSIEATENAARNEALGAIRDFHTGEKMMGSATQRTAHAVLVLRQVWVDKGNEPVQWSEYVKGGKAKSSFDNAVIKFLLGDKPKVEAGKKPTPTEMEAIGRRAKTEQMIRRAVEFAAYLTLQRIGMDKFVDGFWIVSPTDCVYAGYNPNIKNPIPLDGRTFSANRPPREDMGEKSDTDVRIVAGVAAFVKAQKPEPTRAVRTPEAVLAALKDCTVREVGPLATTLLALLSADPDTDGAEFDLTVSDLNNEGDASNKAWNACEALRRRLTSLANDPDFMEEDKSTAKKAA